MLAGFINVTLMTILFEKRLSLNKLTRAVIMVTALLDSQLQRTNGSNKIDHPSPPLRMHSQRVACYLK